MLTTARRVAADVLGPAAAEVERTGVIPTSHLKALADAGLYGAVTGSDPIEFSLIVEALAEGCLSTTFVWLQHHGLAGRIAFSPGQADLVPPGFLDDMLSGRIRAGIVQAGLLPGDPLLTAAPQDDGSWVLDGFSPWCTGWGMISELLVATRHAADHETVVWFRLPAEELCQERDELVATRLLLQAVDATETVSLRFNEVVVGAEAWLGDDDYAAVGHAAGNGLRPNGSLALGLANRCVAEINAIGGRDSAMFEARSSRLQHRVEEVRAQLDGAGPPEEMASARAAANELAVEAAVAFVAASGARAAIAGSAAERAMREATFLLVFGSRPQIKEALLSLG